MRGHSGATALAFACGALLLVLLPAAAPAAVNHVFRPGVTIRTGTFTGTATLKGWVTDPQQYEFSHALISAAGTVKLRVVKASFGLTKPLQEYGALLQINFPSGSLTVTPVANGCSEETNQNISVSGTVWGEGTSGFLPVTTPIVKMNWGELLDPKTGNAIQGGFVDGGSVEVGDDVAANVVFSCPGAYTATDIPAVLRFAVSDLPEIRMNLAKIPGSTWYSQLCQPGGYCSKIRFTFKR